MNVNLTPSVDNSKVTSVTKSASSSDLVSSDSGETKGFLDKLASLLLGSKGDGETSQTDSGPDSKVLADGETQVSDSESLKSSSTDVILAQESGDSDDAASVDVEVSSVGKEGGDSDDSAVAKTANSNDAEIPEKLKPFIANNEDEQVKLQAKTAQAMDDGDKILGRLQEANQTLVKKDGKPLPHDQKMVSDTQNVDLEVKENTNDTTELPISDEELIQETVLQAENSQQLTQAPVSIHGSQLGSVESLPDEHLLKQAKNGKNVQALSDSEIAAPLAKQSPNGAAQPLDDKPQDEQSDPTLAATAIPWASSSTIDNTVVDADGKAVVKPMQQGVVAQPVHQALQAQHLATQAEKAMAAQSSMPAAVSTEAAAQAQLNPAATMHANPILSSALLNQADPSVSQAALKAGLGAKALADGKQKGQAADSHLAQQLSAVAGQQGVNGAQSMRADTLQTAQTSSPLQLARSDMAADEVAERVQVMLSKNLKNIDIRLDPPELGRMHIRMNMNSDGATVHFTVANQQARDALEQSMPRLREMLNNQGVQLGDTSVQQQNSGQQQRYAAGGNGTGGQSMSGDDLNSDENLDTNVKLDLNVAAKRDGISYYA